MKKKLGELIDFNVQLSSDNPTLHAFLQNVYEMFVNWH